jgi:hypothetical protein
MPVTTISLLSDAWSTDAVVEAESCAAAGAAIASAVALEAVAIRNEPPAPRRRASNLGILLVMSPPVRS